MSDPKLAPHPFRPPVGAWRLHPGHALGLRPKQAALLRVFCGRVWVTVGMASDPGDRFLGPGDVLYVPAGAHLVVEPVFVGCDAAPVRFDWSDQVAAPSRFARDVVRPAGELVVALVQAGNALIQVVGGLVGYGEFLVAGRGKTLPCIDSMRS